MAAKGEPPLIDIDAEELVVKLRLNSIPGREAITSLMSTIVELGFTLNTVSTCNFILYQFVANCTVLYGYKTCYYIFHAFYIVRLQDQLLVCHDILLDILNHKFGIEDKALKWFDSYLRPRSFKVVINGTYSEEQNLTVSVPQGSCVRANIFNLYCALLEEVIPSNLQISGFADDHSIRDSFKADNRREELNSKGSIQECMIRI